MIIALAPFNPTVGDFEGNSARILELAHEAQSRGAELAVFSELCLCGYPPQDLTERPAFDELNQKELVRLAKKIPTTYRTMLVATLAIAGIPPLAGFFSKDEILGRAFGVSHLLWLVGWITAGVTAFYMFRLLFLTFYGESRVSPEASLSCHGPAEQR